MIERNLRYVTVRKYGTAFLEAFGMLPLTYFGAVGDNLTDNYANIQVAIDESIKRGLKFIFVPNGTYLYTGNLLHVDKIKFIGNSDSAKIYDGVNEQKIYQIGTQVPFDKGTALLSDEVDEDGSIFVELPIKSATEMYLIIDNNVIYLTDDGLILVNGSLFSNQVISLGNNTQISNIEININGITIDYVLSDVSGTIDTSVEWRAR